MRADRVVHPYKCCEDVWEIHLRWGINKGRGWAEFPQNDGGGMRMKIRDCMTAHVVCVGPRNRRKRRHG